MIETFRECIRRNEVQKFSDLTNKRSRETMEVIGNAKLMLSFGKLGKYMDTGCQV